MKGRGLYIMCGLHLTQYRPGTTDEEAQSLCIGLGTTDEEARSLCIG